MTAVWPQFIVIAQWSNSGRIKGQSGHGNICTSIFHLYINFSFCWMLIVSKIFSSANLQYVCNTKTSTFYFDWVIWFHKKEGRWWSCNSAPTVLCPSSPRNPRPPCCTRNCMFYDNWELGNLNVKDVLQFSQFYFTSVNSPYSIWWTAEPWMIQLYLLSKMWILFRKISSPCYPAPAKARWWKIKL